MFMTALACALFVSAAGGALAADIAEMAKEAIGASEQPAAEETASPVAEDEADKEFVGFSDFFMPAIPEMEEAPMPMGGGMFGGEDNANVTLPAMAVTGIVWGTKQPRAIIDGQVYGEGDVVGTTEAEILKINADGILFMYKNKEFLMKRSELVRTEG